MDHFLCGLDSGQNSWYTSRPVTSTSTHEFAIGNSSFQLIPISGSSLNTGVHSTTDTNEYCNSNSGSDSNSTTNPNSAFKPLHEVKIKTENVPDDRPSLTPVPTSIGFPTLSTTKNHKNKSGERWNTKKVCNICGKILSRGDKLKNHIRIHTNDFPYHCESCGQKFIRSEGLRVHTRIHTGERPYVCDLCGKAYTRKDKLTRHAVVHTGERPFVCSHCGKSFTRKDKMRRHEFTHMVTKPFTCSPCKLVFMCQETLNTHLERKHPERLPYAILQQHRLHNPNYPQELDISCLIDNKAITIAKTPAIEAPTSTSLESNSNSNPPATTTSVTTQSTQTSSPVHDSASLINPSGSIYHGLTIPSTSSTSTVDTSLISSATLLSTSSILSSFTGGLSFSNAPSAPGGSATGTS